MIDSCIRLLRNGLATTLLLALVFARPASAQTATTVRVGVNLSTYGNLPLFLAVDKGYFKAAGLDVDMQPFTTSSTAQIPKLARGDVDIMPLALGPAFFNQFADGFNVKLVAGESYQKAGWNGTTWLSVRQDVWDAGTIRQLKDLRGKTIDGVAPGSPIDFLALTAIKNAGLTEADVTYTNKFRDAPSWISALRNKAVEVQGLPEPVATQMQVQGMAHKWIAIGSVAPWFDESFLAASAGFAKDHHDALVRFLRAYLRAAVDVNRSGGKWTPELIATTAKWTQLPQDVIRQIPGPSYAGDGKIDTASVTRQEEFWKARGLVKELVPADSIVDTAPLREAAGGRR